ncbi:tRNA adenosine(34) deaminase TadA [Clostridium thermosuccinogenes]|uniref:tRNA adenosine(34) deaminase TadA n=1 Tax=Clostridium thermosuccinogenes TaxID=84032 RepID=UPI000CCC672C|nr:tRNA adenosine(34) deaminase TadA [Pseudoclostridium thermosuccinogenes]PNT91665.1 tRNA adenosine(34) deaminase TadA [Pseudoclostridium thermosuccinogenes]
MEVVRSLKPADTSLSKKEGPTHEWFMKQALKEAKKAYDKDETPVGAVIVKGDKIIARGHNLKELKQDPTMHAEISALQKASKKLGTWRLNDCDMYVTLEPCTMCAGAILHARINRLFIGTPDPKAGAVGSVINVLEVEQFNHRVEVMQGVLEDECSDILKRFFRELRARKSK